MAMFFTYCTYSIHVSEIKKKKKHISGNHFQNIGPYKPLCLSCLTNMVQILQCSLLLFLFSHIFILFNTQDHIGGVMVGMITSSAIEYGFETWSGQIKNYKIGFCSIVSNHALYEYRLVGLESGCVEVEQHVCPWTVA